MSIQTVTRRFFALILLLSLIPSSGSAQFGVELGELYLSMEEETHVSFVADLPPFESFDFFLVVRIDYEDLGEPSLNLANGIGSWEAQVDVPGELTITARELRPATSINVSPVADNYVVGMGQMVAAASTPYALVRYSALLLDGATSDLVLTLNASSPSSFDDPGGPGLVPGWLEFRPHTECESSRHGCLRSFGRWTDRLVVNCSEEPECEPQATTRESWGSVKGKFGND